MGDVMALSPKKGLFARITRDLVLFILGCAIIINEVWFRVGDEREAILILGAGLVGLPFVQIGDNIFRRNGNGKSDATEYRSPYRYPSSTSTEGGDVPDA